MSQNRESGQVMVLTLVFLIILCALVVGVFQISWAVRERIRIQQAVDLSVLSTLNTEASALNALALGNRTLLAQDALGGRLTATVSEVTFYRKLLEKVSWLVDLIPYAGPTLAQVLRRGGEGFERLARQIARAGIPLLGIADRGVEAEADIIRTTLPFSALRSARRSLEVNAPQARIHPLSQAILLRQAMGVSGAINPLPEAERIPLLDKTLDPHSRKRDWDIGRGALTFPIRKRGRGMAEAVDFNAWDRLQFRVLTWRGWRWKTILSSSARASEFGYRGHGRYLDLDGDRLPTDLTLVVTSKQAVPVFPSKNVTFTAISSGRLHYRRPDRPQEKPNLFNPFWRTSLIPVAEDEGVRKLVPSPVREAVRH